MGSDFLDNLSKFVGIYASDYPTITMILYYLVYSGTDNSDTALIDFFFLNVI